MPAVMKFGGSCLASPEGLDGVVQRLRESEAPVVVVVSALQGVTEQLIALGREAGEGRTDFGKLAAIHRSFLDHVAPSTRGSASSALDTLLDELAQVLTGIAYLREISPRTRDRLHSLGERMSVALITGYLRGRGLDAVALQPGELGLKTDGHFGNARIIDEAAREVRGKLDGVGLAVVPGFFGVDAKGDINTLGRGGSDYTATWLAAALGWDCILWKDVGGFRTADPKMVPTARALPALDYLDALELAHYGSSVIHDKALAPAMRASTKVEIRGFADPSQKTVISAEPNTALAVAALAEAAVVDIHGFETDILPSLAALLTEMAAVRAAPLLLTEASPRGETSIVLRPGDLDPLTPHLARLAEGVRLQVRRDLGVVSIIGRGMTGRVGFAAQVFQTLAGEGINILAIAQTVSERNVSVIVERGSVVRAARSIHRRFIENGAEGPPPAGA